MSSVSVIVPSYNRAAVISETLESLVQQERIPDEVLVVDDGSHDATVAVVEDWMKAHKGINARLLRMNINRGKPIAVNHALAACSGTFVVVLDSDDVLVPDALSIQTRFLEENPAAGMVFGRAFESRDGKRTGTIVGGIEQTEGMTDVRLMLGDFLMHVNPVVSSSVMFRRSVFESLGGLNPDLRYTHDWDYWIRISHRFPVGYIGRPLVFYRVDTHNSSSANRVGTFKEIVALIRQGNIRASERRRALLRQTKFNADLAVRDGKVLDASRILLVGLVESLGWGRR